MNVKNLNFNDLLPIYQIYTKLNEASNELQDIFYSEKNIKKKQKLDGILNRVDTARNIIRYLDLQLFVAQSQQVDDY